MANYFVNKPRITLYESVPAILLRIFLPVTLLWDGMSYLINQFFGELFAKFIWQQAKDSDKQSFLNLKVGLHYTYHTISTHDHALLETLEIGHCSQNNLNDERRSFVIYFPDNHETLHSLISQMQDDALALERNVIGFNYRSVGQSTGHLKSAQDLWVDGLAQVQRLLDQGVKPEQITLKGKGFGGAIATLVAYHLMHHDQHVYLFNDRSFSSLSNLLAHKIFPIHSQANFLEKALFIALLFCVKVGLSLLKWDINTKHAFLEIKDQHKEYTVVRIPHRTTQQEQLKSIEDKTIPYLASLHMGFKQSRHADKEAKKRIQALFADQAVALEAFEFSNMQFKNRLENRKMVVSNKATTRASDAHDIPLCQLSNRKNVLGSTFFYHFVNHTVDSLAQTSATKHNHGK